VTDDLEKQHFLVVIKHYRVDKNSAENETVIATADSNDYVLLCVVRA